MRILVVMDPIRQVDVYRDTTFGFILSAQRLGHEVYYCEQSQLFVRNGHGCAYATPIRVELNPEAPFELADQVPYRLSQFDTIWMRKDPPFDMDYVFLD